MDLIPQETKHQKEGKTTPAATWCSECQASSCIEVPILCLHDTPTLNENIQQNLKRSFSPKNHEDELKQSKRQKKYEEFEMNNAEIGKYEDKVDKRPVESKSIKSDKTKTKTIQGTNTDSPCEKETELLKLDVLTEEQREDLRSRVETKQTQMYQKQSQVIQQAPELEDEAQRFEMYLASGVEEEADTEKKTDVAGVSSVQEPDKQKEQSEKMDSSVVDYNIDLAVTPVLHEIIDAKLGGQADSNVRDVVVIQSPNIKATVFADFNDNGLRSVYQRGKRTCSSTLQVSGKPWSIAVINEGMVAVSLYVLNHIITVAVTPDLELLSTIQTSKIYWGLSTLDQSTLVAGSKDPPSVDLIDMKGSILKTFTTLPAIGQCFIDPHYIHVTREGTILVSDYGLKSVICVSRSGNVVFTYAPTGDRALICTWGITSSTTGDVLVADCWAHKVIHLSKTGDYIRDILTEDDGLLSPTGLCVDGDKLCVALVMKGVHIYKFGSN